MPSSFTNHNDLVSERSGAPARRAFTLIELLASSVLAALLMLAVASLLQMVNTHNDAARRTVQTYRDTSILRDQIRRDAVHAQHIQISANRLRLSGHMATDVRTLKQTFRPAEVTYAIASHQSRTALVRRETQLGSIVVNRTRLDVLWFDVSAFKVERFDDGYDDASVASAAPSGMSPMPGRLAFALFDSQGHEICSEEILHHHAVQ